MEFEAPAVAAPAPTAPAPATQVAPASAPVAPVSAPEPVAPLTVSEAKAHLSNSSKSVESINSGPPSQGTPLPGSVPAIDSTGDVGNQPLPTYPAEFSNLPEGWSVKEVPEGHFYRDRGKTHLAVPPGWENEMNAFLNDPVKRADVSLAQQAALDARHEAARWQATAEYYVERAMALAQNPDVALKVARIREDYGEQEAEYFLTGLFDEDQQALSQKLGEIQRQVVTSEQERQADAVIAGMQKTIQQIAPNTNPDVQRQLMQGFALMLSENKAKPTAGDFKAYLKQFGIGSPPPAPVDRDAIKAEIMAEIRHEAEQAQRTHSQKLRTTPFAGVNSLPAGAAPVQTSDVPLTLAQARASL